MSWSARCLNLLKRHTAVLLLLLAHAPFLAIYFHGLWQRQPHYQFFPFAIGAFVWLFPARKRVGPGQWTTLPWLLIGLDLVCVSIGIWRSVPWMFAAGAGCVIIAWCWASREEGYERRLTYLALLPLMTLRLPVNADLYLIQLLQRLTTGVASRTLERFGYLHVRSGNVLDFPGKQFMVQEACSGVQSLFTLLFIASLVICVRRRTLAHGAVLLASAVVFAGMMNMIRVMSIAIAWDDYQLDLSEGIRHDVLGYIALAIAAGLLLSADSFLSFITDPVPDIHQPNFADGFRNPLTALWNWLFAVLPLPPLMSASANDTATDSRSRTGRLLLIGLSGTICVLLLAVQGVSLLRETSAAATAAPPVDSVKLLSAESLPGVLAGFTRGAYVTETRHTTSELGEFSNLWDYSNGNIPTRVACDYPFFGWHGLELCYRNQGWQVQEISTTADADGWQAVVIQMLHPTGGRHGTVFYSLFESSGKPLEPEGLGNTRERIFDRLFRQNETRLIAPVVYQSQVFTESPLPFDDEKLDLLKQLHFAARAEMRARILGETRAERP